MEGDRDLQLLLLALRNRAVDLDRLADAVNDWGPRAGPGLMSFLIGRGVVSADDLHHLGAATVDLPAKTEKTDPSLPTTPHLGGDGAATTDLPARADAAAEGAGLPVLPAAADRYRVIRLHQAGGLGQVWIARDTAIGRDVALKTIRPDRAGDAATRARFVREAHVTGQLEHPSIVPLYDLAGGGPDPFYVMRFVSGRTLAAAAADYHHRRAAGQAGRLDLTTLLDAFVSVCRAVAFAHARGILHRDLKGQNIAIGEFGEVFLLDWGLAKHVSEPDDPARAASGDESGDVTVPGVAVGTPAYMAPEVAAGRPATKAADVYGLGAVLYVVLTGGAPYTGATAVEVIGKVAAADPPPVRAVNPAAPPALEAVCHKAMARDPAARYPSAEEVATEVRRWLADEPVAAHREPWPGRAARWARRRKTTVVAAAVLLLTATAASSAAAVLVWREQQQTRAAWGQAEAEKVKATKNADAAIKVVHDLSRYVDAAEVSSTQVVRSERQRKVVLDATLASYERLLELHPDDTYVRTNVARMCRYRANLSRLLNETADAEASYRQASRHFAELAAADPRDAAYRENIAETSRDLAMLLKNTGRLREASEIMDGSVRAFEDLRQAEPDNHERRRRLAVTLIDRAEMDHLLGRYADAERAARTAADLYAGLAESPNVHPEPVDPLFRGMAENRLALALRDQGRADVALAAHDAAVDRLAGLAKISPSRDALHHYHRFRAERAWTRSRVPALRAAAVADLDDAIPGWEKLAKEFPLVPLYRYWQGVGRLHRGRLHALGGRRDDAARDLTEAAAILEGLAGKYPDIPAYRAELGRTQTALGQLATDPQVAAGWYQKAREMLAEAVKRYPENVQFSEALKELEGMTTVPPP
jgi:tetratricopeptide (TPR) repeat protein/tRNA A-37 threonylcarbamoyl transferase component Bud32